MTVYQQIREKAQELAPTLRALRQDFHRYAEDAWTEVRTSSLVAKRLTELGYEVLQGQEVCLDEGRMGLPGAQALEAAYQRALRQGAAQPWAERARGGFTGVIGLLDCGEGPVIAMRFDIDALGVYESGDAAHRPAREGFASVNEGVMHACGHDGHTAIGLGVAEVLMAIRPQLHGRIKLIFQPAEEGARGAKAIVEHGHLDDVDYTIGSHMGARGDREAEIGLNIGSTLATTKLDVTFSGRAAHAGAAPEEGANAMLAAATAVLNLHAIPRSGAGSTRVNVGRLRAGSGRNVVCDRAELELEVRGSTTEANQYMEDYARRIVRAAAEMHGCTVSVRTVGSAPSLNSDERLQTRCARVCEEQLGLRVAYGPQASASEDYSYMVDRVRAHGGLGLCFSTLAPCAAPLHNEGFDFDESALPNAVQVFCALACDLMAHPEGARETEEQA